MGWWDEGILGGDTPLDLKGMIEDTILGDWDGKSDRELTAAQVNDHLAGILALGASGWPSKGEDHQLFLQVVGHTVITTGAILPNDLRQKVLQAVDDEITFLQSGSDEIGWSNPERRIERLQDFRAQVDSYEDGKPVEVAERGLMEKMCSKLEGVVICHGCDHENPDGSKYCNSCGKKL